MSPEQLRAFHPFLNADQRSLRWAVERSSRVQLPENRWLVRPGRLLSGCFYLLRGRLRLVSGAGSGQVVAARSARSRWPVYPGPTGVRTLSPVRLLRLDATPEALEALIAAEGVVPLLRQGLPQVEADAACWEHRFLASPLMQRLSPAAWQRVLRAMRSVPCKAGDTVLRQGDRGDLCYVLAVGRAEVCRHGERLAVLQPGDFFGEEALITGAGRNASVRMIGDGEVVSLAADAFHSLLLSEVVRAVPDAGRRVTLDVGSGPVSRLRARGRHLPAARRLPLERLRELAGGLDPGERYAVRGGTAAQRSLAVFLLAERGFDAVPLSG